MIENQRSQNSSKPVLYLLIGYPGAGKTTISKIIARLTGAAHIWADHERHVMFVETTHSLDESRQLYDYLNQRTEQILSDGNSVVFDTNFNFRSDRDYLRIIARRTGAATKLIWIRTDAELARGRAISTTHASDNSYDTVMQTVDFDRIIHNLEPPTPDEQAIELRGTGVTDEYIRQAVNLS